MAKLIAVPFGTDRITGDSSFYVTDLEDENVVGTEDSTYEELLLAWQKQDPESRLLNEEGFDVPPDEQPVGFWLMTKDNLKIACIPADADDGGSDSLSYGMNRACKMLCVRLCTKEVTKPGYDPNAEVPEEENEEDEE